MPIPPFVPKEKIPLFLFDVFVCVCYSLVWLTGALFLYARASEHFGEIFGTLVFLFFLALCFLFPQAVERNYLREKKGKENG